MAGFNKYGKNNGKIVFFNIVAIVLIIGIIYGGYRFSMAGYKAYQEKKAREEERVLEEQRMASVKSAQEELREFTAGKTYRKAQQKEINNLIEQYTKELEQAKEDKINGILKIATNKMSEIKTDEELKIDEELAQKKVKDKESLQKLIAGKEYRKVEKKEVDNLITQYSKKIDKASSSSDVDSVFSEGKSKINAIKTDIELTKEEEEEKKAKEEAKKKAKEEAKARAKEEAERKAEEEAEARREAEEQKTSGYILPNSDSEYLDYSDISNLSSREIWIAKNEIYARHGRRFNNSELQNYFDSKSWYNGTISPDNDSYIEDRFNSYEKENVKFLAANE